MNRTFLITLAFLLPCSVLAAEHAPWLGTHVIDPDSFAYAHETLVLDAGALREQALANETIRLRLFGKDYAFNLTPVYDRGPGMAPEAVIIFDVSAPQGVTGSLVLPGEWVQGQIYDGYEIIYLEPRVRTDPPNAVETIVYRNSDMKPIPGP